MGRLTTRQLSRKRDRQSRFNPRAELQPGDMLQERYRIVGMLGVGGMSSVYQARDMRFPTVTKLCAVKEMVIATSDPQLRQLTIKLFEREASMLAMLDHPAIPDVSDYFTEGNRSYLVQELIRGKNLQEWLEENDLLIDQEMALDWALQICEALSYLHSQKPQPIVFRDLKPSNIMLDQYNRIRLIDFGIAKIFEAEENKGTMIGTEGYSPPEQYRGEATPAVDVYALGATLHHLMTRQDPRLEPPFTFPERPIRAVNPSISPALESIIMRCLSYNANDRFPDATALKDALDLVTQASPSRADIERLSPPTAIITTPSGHHPTITAVTTAIQVGATKAEAIWSFRCEDEIRSKPTVMGGRVFVGAYDNNLYAVSSDKGEFLWKYPTLDGIASAPCLYDDLVLVTSSDRHLYAIRQYDGEAKWRFPTDGAIYSSPAVRFDHVFFGSDDGYFYAVNAKRGKLAWKTNAYSPVRSSPFMTEERVYFGTEGGYIYCLEISTGKAKWHTQAKRAVTSSPTVADDIVFVGSHDATVYALDAGSGWAIWRFRARRPIISSPLVHEGVVYIGSSDNNLYAIDMDTGRQVWVYEAGGQIASSPAIWNDAIYFGSVDGNIYSLTLKRGELRWRFETEGRVIGAPTIVDGVVYVGSTDHYLYALPA